MPITIINMNFAITIIILLNSKVNSHNPSSKGIEGVSKLINDMCCLNTMKKTLSSHNL